MSLMNDNGGGLSAFMPVIPGGMGYGGGGYGMDGFGGGGWFWFMIIFVIAMFSGNWGGFGYGGNGGAVNTVNNDLQRGFDQQAVMGGLNGITASINGLGNQICTAASGINQSIYTGFANAEAAAANRQMVGMQTDFAMQTAMNQGFNTLNSTVGLGMANMSADIARENCADRQATMDAMNALSNKMDTIYNSLQMQNYQDKLDAKNERIQALENQLNMANFAASQSGQTATIEAGQRLLANEIEQYVAPKAIPAYIMPNPNCCPQNNGCGCGNRFVA